MTGGDSVVRKSDVLPVGNGAGRREFMIRQRGVVKQRLEH
jgi:hypothetical protein